VLAEQLDLFQHLVVIVDLGIAGGEDVVPEQRHLFFERPLGVHQIIQPVDVAHRRLAAGEQGRRLIAQQRVRVSRGLRLRMQQLLDGRLVALASTRLKLVTAGSEARPSHQMCHQFDVVLICHTRVSSLIGSVSNRYRRAFRPLGLRVRTYTSSRRHGTSLNILRQMQATPAS